MNINKEKYFVLFNNRLTTCVNVGRSYQKQATAPISKNPVTNYEKQGEIRYIINPNITIRSLWKRHQ